MSPSKRRAKNKKLPDLLRRQRALEALQAKFAGKTFDLGKADCVQLARSHLVKMGHSGLPKPAYSNEVGARLALKRLGFDSLEQLLDSLLPRIAPAAMRPGDLALIPAQSDAPAADIGTVVVSVGRKFMGWHPDHPMLAIVEPDVDAPFIAAWRA